MDFESGCLRENFSYFPLIIFSMYVPLVGAFDRLVRRWRKPSRKTLCFKQVPHPGLTLIRGFWHCDLLPGGSTVSWHRCGFGCHAGVNTIENLHTVFAQRCGCVCVCVILGPNLGLSTAASVLHSVVFPDSTQRKIFIQNQLKNRWMKLPWPSTSSAAYARLGAVLIAVDLKCNSCEGEEKAHFEFTADYTFVWFFNIFHEGIRGDLPQSRLILGRCIGRCAQFKTYNIKSWGSLTLVHSCYCLRSLSKYRCLPEDL